MLEPAAVADGKDKSGKRKHILKTHQEMPIAIFERFRRHALSETGSYIVKV